MTTFPWKCDPNLHWMQIIFLICQFVLLNRPINIHFKLKYRGYRTWVAAEHRSCTSMAYVSLLYIWFLYPPSLPLWIFTFQIFEIYIKLQAYYQDGQSSFIVMFVLFSFLSIDSSFGNWSIYPVIKILLTIKYFCGNLSRWIYRSINYGQ